MAEELVSGAERLRGIAVRHLFGTLPVTEAAGNRSPAQSCSVPALMDSATAVLFPPAACCSCTYPLTRNWPHVLSGITSTAVPAPNSDECDQASGLCAPHDEGWDGRILKVRYDAIDC